MLSRVGLGDKSTAQNALKCGDVKYGLYINCSLNSVEFPYFKGHLENIFEHYLDMVNLLFNTIQFQRANNCEGYIEAITKFLPYCFSCNRHEYTPK